MDETTKELGLGSVSKRKKAGRKELRSLVESQEYRCALSGVALVPDTAELDHIVSVSAGGDHSINNLQIVHVDINRMKAAMDNDKFIKLCKLVAKWNS